MNRPRLVAIGLNYVKAGGLSRNRELVVLAAQALAAGQKKIDFDAPDYGGTFYWHRLAAYVCVLVSSSWEIAGERVLVAGVDLLDDARTLGAAFDSIAYLEAVKCSPPWAKSEPTPDMRANCPRRFLETELRAIRPELLLVLGLTTPIGLCDSGAPFEPKPMRASWGTVTVVRVPHPSGFGDNKKAYVAKLAQNVRLWRGASG